MPGVGEFQFAGGEGRHEFQLRGRVGLRKLQVQRGKLLEAASQRDVLALVKRVRGTIGITDGDSEVAASHWLREEIGGVEGAMDRGVPEEGGAVEVREKRGVVVELPHPFRRDVLVVVETVQDAVLVFIFEAVGELEHLETAEIGTPAFFEVGLQGGHLPLLGGLNEIRQTLGETFAFNQRRQFVHEARARNAVLLQVFRANFRGEFLIFFYKCFIIRYFYIMRGFVCDGWPHGDAGTVRSG